MGANTSKSSDIYPIHLKSFEKQQIEDFLQRNELQLEKELGLGDYTKVV